MSQSAPSSGSRLTPATPSVGKSGYWASLCGAALAVLWMILAVIFGAAPWTGIGDYAETFRRSQVSNTAPALLLAPTMIVLFACLHYSAKADWKINSLIALAFTAVYATIITSIDILQLHSVSLNVLQGDLEGISRLALPDFHSAFFALDTLGYFFLGAAGLAVVPLFAGPGRHRWIRGLLLFNGALGLIGLVLVPLDVPWLIIAGGGLWGLAFPLEMVLNSREFGLALPAHHGPA